MHNHCQILQKEKMAKVIKVVILVSNTSSCPVLHFYQVPSKYSEGYSSYRADKTSISNETMGDTPKVSKPGHLSCT